MKDVEKRPDVGGTRSLDQWLSHLSKRQKTKRYIPKYMKPKVRHDEMSQFPFRCPLCWTKYLFIEPARECLEKCWEELPGRVFAHMDKVESEPKETGSWQWDIGNHRLGEYVGVCEYDRGPPKYFKSLHYEPFIEVTLDELKELLEGAEIVYLWQPGSNPLPSELEKFADIPRETFAKSNKMPFTEMVEDMTGSH